MPKTRFPRVIHRIWLGPPMPPRLDEYWTTWTALNPEWECRTWTEAEMEPLIDQMGLTAPYRFVTRAVAKSDIGRLAILWRHGGLYVDTDYECLKPFDPLVREWERAGHSFVMTAQDGRPLGERHAVTNALGLSVPRHDAAKWILGEAVKRLSLAQRYRRAPNPLWTTGTELWRHAALTFPGVYVSPYRLTHPVTGNEAEQRRINMSRVPSSAVIPETAYAVHHMTRLWDTHVDA